MTGKDGPVLTFTALAVLATGCTGLRHHTLVHDGTERDYYLYTPDSAGASPPLVPAARTRGTRTRGTRTRHPHSEFATYHFGGARRYGATSAFPPPAAPALGVCYLSLWRRPPLRGKLGFSSPAAPALGVCHLTLPAPEPLVLPRATAARGLHAATGPSVRTT